jgi:hypothetical protein
MLEKLSSATQTPFLMDVENNVLMPESYIIVYPNKNYAGGRGPSRSGWRAKASAASSTS